MCLIKILRGFKRFSENHVLNLKNKKPYLPISKRKQMEE